MVSNQLKTTKPHFSNIIYTLFAIDASEEDNKTLIKTYFIFTSI